MGLQTDAAGNFYYAKSARHALPARRAASRHAAQGRAGRLADRHPGHRLSRRQRRLPESRRLVRRHRSGRALEPEEPHQLGQARRLLRQHVRLSRRDRHVGLRHGAAALLDHQRLRPLARRAALGRQRSLGTADRLAAQSFLRLRQGASSCRTKRSTARCKAACASCRIPAFPTGVMRGRFHPRDGQLYLCGMFAWAGNQQQPGGLYRLRYTGQPVHLPVGLAATHEGLRITFSGPLERHFGRGRRQLLRESLVAQADGQLRLAALRRAFTARRVRAISIRQPHRPAQAPRLAPTWGMEIHYDVQTSNRSPVSGLIHNTVYLLRN